MNTDFFLPIVKWIDPWFLWYFSAVNAVYAIILFFGSLKVYFRHKELSVEDITNILRSNSLPEISFIIPFYNESSNIAAKIENTLKISYRYKQIIAVNDGSQDDSLEILKKMLDLVPVPKIYPDLLPTQAVKTVYRSKKHPEITVIDKEHGKKFDTVNVGLNACNNYFFIVSDADTFIDDDGFELLIRPLLTSPDTIAVGASVRIKNGCGIENNRITTAKFPKSFLAAIQSLEYLRSFLMRQGWDYLKGNIVIAGAFSIFPRDLIIKIGGFSPTVAEDMEIIIRLQRLIRRLKLHYKIFYLPDPIAWTEGPDTMKILGRQRSNWHRGTMEALWYHKAIILNPRYGFFGLFIYPFWIWGEALEPVVEVLGFTMIIVSYILGFLDGTFFLLLMSISLGFTFVYTVSCILIEELSFKKYHAFKSLMMLILYSFVENIGYRQMSLFWRCRGIVQFFKRFKEVKKETKIVNDWVKESIKKGHLL